MKNLGGRSVGSVLTWLGLALWTLGVSGCGSAEQSSGPVAGIGDEAGSGTETEAESPAARRAAERGAALNVAKPLTDEELASFVRQIDSAVAHLSESELGALISAELLTEATLQGLTLSVEDLKGFQDAVRDSFQKVFSDVLTGCRSGGDYRYVRTLNAEGPRQKTLLFRLTLPESGGLNYHQLIVQRGADERPRIADLVIWKSGQQVSRTFRLANLASLVESSVTPAQLSDSDNLWLQHEAQVRSIREATQQGKFADALALYKSLPEAVQQQREFFESRWGAAVGAGSTELADAAEAYRVAWPDDPSVPFRQLVASEAAGQWPQMIDAADRIQQITGDPYAGVLKVRPLMESQQAEAALNVIRSARAVAETDSGVYWLQLNVELKRKSHGETAKLLTDMQQRFGLDFSRLEQIPESSEFLASAEGQRWLAERTAETEPGSSDAAPDAQQSAEDAKAP